MLCGRGDQTIVLAAGAKVQPEAQVILIDGRDLDPGEKEAVAESPLIHLPNLADLLTLPLPEQPIYLHFDSDVLRLSGMAAVNYPAEGGATLDVIEASLARLAQTGRIAAVSVTLWNPELDEDSQAEEVVMGLVERLVDQL
jgi:arginase